MHNPRQSLGITFHVTIDPFTDDELDALQRATEARDQRAINAILERHIHATPVDPQCPQWPRYETKG